MAASEIKTWVEMAGTLISTAAIIVGGIWAYYRFEKDRTYRPRLDVQLSGEWRMISDVPLLHVRVAVKNIGASVVWLDQHGTGLRVSVPVLTGEKARPAALTWKALSVFSIMKDHKWIEPGETVTDELLVSLGESPRAMVMFEARFVWRWREGMANISLVTRKMIAAGSRLSGDNETMNGGARQESFMGVIRRFVTKAK